MFTKYYVLKCILPQWHKMIFDPVDIDLFTVKPHVVEKLLSNVWINQFKPCVIIEF